MKTKKVPRTRRTVITFTAFQSSIGQRGCQTLLFFAPVSVVESCRCEWGVLRHRLARCKSQQVYAVNPHDPPWNQRVTPGVVESSGPVAQSITFRHHAQLPSAGQASARCSLNYAEREGMVPIRWSGPPGGPLWGRAPRPASHLKDQALAPLLGGGGLRLALYRQGLLRALGREIRC